MAILCCYGGILGLESISTNTFQGCRSSAAAIRYGGGKIEAVGGHFFVCAVDVVLSVRFALSNRDPTGR